MMTLYIVCGAIGFLSLGAFFLGSGDTIEHARCADANHDGPCPSSIIRQVFSRRDLEFVEGESSARLRQMYLKERRRIAIAWIRRTARELNLTMKSHVHAVRMKADLQAQSEVKIFAQYFGLRCLCGFMLASVAVFPPSSLQNLAVYASRLSHRLDVLQWEPAAQAVPGSIRFNR